MESNRGTTLDLLSESVGARFGEAGGTIVNLKGNHGEEPRSCAGG